MISFVHILHARQSNDVELLETDLVELDDVGVVQHLHDLNFPVNLLQVNSIQLGLVDDLNGHLQSDRASTVQL